MINTIEMTPKQYADKQGCHVSYIHRLLTNEEYKKLPGVVSIKKFGRFYVLKVYKE